MFLLFDEGSSDVHGGGHVAAIAAGSAVRTATSAQPASHYVVLRTIEDALGLPRLGAPARVRPLAGIWR